MIVDVAVPVAGIPDALTYSVPRSVEARVSTGVRVLVHVVNRKMVGLVVGTRENDVRPVDAAKLKPILEVLDAAAVVDDNQLVLARFVADYYAADLGLAVRLVMPPGTEHVVDRRFALTERGEQARVLSSDLNRHDIALLETFGAGERKRERVFTRAQKERVQKLVAAGLIEQVADEKGASSVRYDESIVAVDGGKDLPKNAHALAAFDAWLRVVKTSSMVQAQAAHTDARGKAKKLEALG